ncbi:MAG: PilZ domain-containing protein, partial [Pseudomonadales bacterium]
MNKETNCIQQSEENHYAERRASSRINVELDVKLQRDDCELGKYAASNISTGGLYLQGNFESIFPGDVLNINFTDFSYGGDTLHNMRALVLNRNTCEAHLTWLDCDSLFWVKLLKLLARATNDASSPVKSDVLLRGA